VEPVRLAAEVLCRTRRWAAIVVGNTVVGRASLVAQPAASSTEDVGNTVAGMTADVLLAT
jgi:hypothetical protein